MSVTKLRKVARPTATHLQDQIGEVHDCLDAVGKRVAAIEALLASINAKAWMAVGALVLAVVVAGLGILSQNFILHNETASKADAAVAVARSTQAVTVNDRAEHEARLKRIEDKLDALK